MMIKKINEQDNDKKLHEEDNDKNEHKLHEEVLDNHNNGPREDGSEQSTDNVAPYAGQGIDTTNGEKPMQDMDATVNQWSETNGMPPNGNGGMPNGNGGMPNGNGGMPGNGGMIVPQLPPEQYMNGAPGLAPDIAQEMGMGMPAPPPMDTNQMMRQMQYTVQQEMKKYHNKVVSPLHRIISQQKEALVKQKNAIKQLSIEIRETKTSSGNLKLDLDVLRENATAKFRETTIDPALQGFRTANEQSQIVTGVQPVPNYQRHKIATARSEIENMDKMLNSQRNPMYN